MYKNLAAVYDRLSDIDYANWADFLERIFAQTGVTLNTVLDLGCGTGSMSLELSKRGYKVTGIDLSEEMLAMAEAKLRNYHVPLFKADMRNIPPLGSFDAVLCLNDSINYLNSAEELLAVFKNVSSLTPKLFVFDLNSFYYLTEVMGNNTFHYVEDDIAYIWENNLLADDLCEMQVTFFVQNGSNEKYRRFDEVHLEKAFKLEAVKEVLQTAGWDLAALYDGYGEKQPGEHTLRWLFVVKPGKNT